MTFDMQQQLLWGACILPVTLLSGGDPLVICIGYISCAAQITLPLVEEHGRGDRLGPRHDTSIHGDVHPVEKDVEIGFRPAK